MGCSPYLLGVGPMSTPDLHFSDDLDGIEARILLAGHAERLAGLVQAHAPLAIVGECLDRMAAILDAARQRVIMDAVNTDARPN